MWEAYQANSIPVSEDAGMIKAVEEGYLNLEKLEAMTAICSVGSGTLSRSQEKDTSGDDCGDDR